MGQSEICTEICTEAVEKYGQTLQLVVAIEEMAELTKELCKSIRTSIENRIAGVTEETADVEIMLEQLKIIYGNRAEVDDVRDQKLQRLQRRINGDPD